MHSFCWRAIFNVWVSGDLCFDFIHHVFLTPVAVLFAVWFYVNLPGCMCPATGLSGCSEAATSHRFTAWTSARRSADVKTVGLIWMTKSLQTGWLCTYLPSTHWHVNPAAFSWRCHFPTSSLIPAAPCSLPRLPVQVRRRAERCARLRGRAEPLRRVGRIIILSGQYIHQSSFFSPQIRRELICNRPQVNN